MTILICAGCRSRWDDNFQFFRSSLRQRQETAGVSRHVCGCGLATSPFLLDLATALAIRQNTEHDSLSLPLCPDLGHGSMTLNGCERELATPTTHRGCSSPRGALRDALLRTTRRRRAHKRFTSDSPSTSECLCIPAKQSRSVSPPPRSHREVAYSPSDAVWNACIGPPNRLPSPRTPSLATGREKRLPPSPPRTPRA